VNGPAVRFARPGGQALRPGLLSTQQRFFLTRLALFPVSILAIITITFALLSLLPANVARAIDGPEATAAQVAQLNHTLGLDLPVPQRYWRYLSGLLHGDLGNSFYSGRPVTDDLVNYLPASADLVLPAFLLAIMIGTAMGTLGAYFAGGIPDRLSRLGMTLLQSCPDFLFALLITLLFFSYLHVLPGPEGQLSLADTEPRVVTHFLPIDLLIAGDWSGFLAAIQHEVLPVVSLALLYSVVFGRTARAVLGSVLDSEFVQFARASGLPEWRVIQYALLGARSTLLTYAAIVLAALIGGDAIIEIVFSWNGLGQWGVNSMLRLDVPAVQAFVLVTGTLTLTIYFLLDLVSARLDPRIRFG
jgi:peptide/nickel transport system permease protein